MSIRPTIPIDQKAVRAWELANENGLVTYGNTRLNVTCFCSNYDAGANQQADVQALFRSVSGQINPIDFSVTYNSGGAVVGGVPLSSGKLLAVSVRANGSVGLGFTYAVISVVTGTIETTLAAGYITDEGKSLTWPGSGEDSPQGEFMSIWNVVTPPGASFDWLFISPVNALYLIEAVTFTLTTSAIAGNRHVSLIEPQGAAPTLLHPAANVQPALTTRRYHFAQRAIIPVAVYDTTNFIESIPPIALNFGQSLGSYTPAIDIDDAFTDIRIKVRSFVSF